ncbi:solute carrier family 13 (sodium-dependent dicarboxylate transporter), member 2/3/5 [Sporobacter termitidis DSM 10068]|uniref:Solute carrier family 13 (Sodium-dependent dicarboxylate transporter), member 2/3/5 n=1 Tax=Sporobacter termitidis DSM 10068 TaxID=1123282 RepID=A0A1M5XWY3_9FIRM|nr:SLC13 family permease [Sporobacter termitidis]SHI04048.1 solute carrier family 13 (sodium-dependent dicarboxylate transporter), member 2/3/5 [Sporobacter termitidis DSM 10068]
MEPGSSLKTRGRVNGLSIHIIVGIVIMFGFGFIPAAPPLTPVGMRVIGIFIGLIYLWSFVQLDWPSLLGLAAVSFLIGQIYPDYANPGIFKVTELSFGHWIIIFILTSLLLTNTLNEIGFTKRIALWFMTRKLAKKSPWAFTTLFLIAVLFIGMFLDLMPILLFAMAIAYEMFDKLGCKKGDSYPVMLMIAIAFTANIAFGMTPISHTVVVIGMSIFSEITKHSINLIEYMAIGIPVGIVAFALMILFMRFVVKPDMSAFKNIDIDKLCGERPGPMDLREKLTAGIFGLVVLFWLVPGLLSIFAPAAGITAFLNSWTIVIPPILGVVVMCIVKVDNKPLLDFEDGFKKSIHWGVIFLVAGAMLIGTVLTEKTTGVTDFLVSVLSPYLHMGLSTFAVVTIIILLTVLIVNFANHLPLTILMLSVCLPLVAAIGIDDKVLAIVVILAAQFGFCVPSSLASIAVIYGDPWVKPKKVFLYGLAMMVVSMLVMTVVGYPLATLIA